MFIDVADLTVVIAILFLFLCRWRGNLKLWTLDCTVCTAASVAPVLGMLMRPCGSPDETLQKLSITGGEAHIPCQSTSTFPHLGPRRPHLPLLLSTLQSSHTESFRMFQWATLCPATWFSRLAPLLCHSLVCLENFMHSKIQPPSRPPDFSFWENTGILGHLFTEHLVMLFLVCTSVSLTRLP